MCGAGFCPAARVAIPAISDQLAKQLAERIRTLRLQHGLSIRGLARLAKLSPELVSRSERGETIATVPSIARICAAFQIDLPTFFSFAQGTPKAELRPELMEGVELLERLPKRSQKRAVRGLRYLLEAGGDLPDGGLLTFSDSIPTDEKPSRKRRASID